MRFLIVFSFMLVLLAGCSEPEAPTVRGQLLNNGRPLSIDNPDEFDLKLVSVNGAESVQNVFVAQVERDGTFVFPGATGRGVPLGTYKVVIETGPVPGAFGRADDRFHKAFTEPNTPFVMTVTRDAAEVNIDIGTKTIVPANH